MGRSETGIRVSRRNSGSAVDPLGDTLRDITRRLRNVEAGAGRGPGSSFGLPFRMGDWEWDGDERELCATNVVSGVRLCVSDVEGGGAETPRPLATDRGDARILLLQDGTVFNSDTGSDVPIYSRYQAIGSRLFVEAGLTIPATAAAGSISATLSFEGAFSPRNAVAGGSEGPFTFSTSGVYSVRRFGEGIPSSGVVQVTGLMVASLTLILALFIDPARYDNAGAGDTPLVLTEGDELTFSFNYELT